MASESSKRLQVAEGSLRVVRVKEVRRSRRVRLLCVEVDGGRVEDMFFLVLLRMMFYFGPY